MRSCGVVKRKRGVVVAVIGAAAPWRLMSANRTQHTVESAEVKIKSSAWHAYSHPHSKLKQFRSLPQLLMVKAQNPPWLESSPWKPRSQRDACRFHCYSRYNIVSTSITRIRNEDLRYVYWLVFLHNSWNIQVNGCLSMSMLWDSRRNTSSLTA